VGVARGPSKMDNGPGDSRMQRKHRSACRRSVAVHSDRFTDDLLLPGYCRARGGTTGKAVVQFCKLEAFPFLRAFFVTEN